MTTTTHTNAFTGAPTTLSPIEQLTKIEADMAEARTQDEQDSLWEKYRALYEEVYQDRIPDPIYTTRCSNEQAWYETQQEQSAFTQALLDMRTESFCEIFLEDDTLPEPELTEEDIRILHLINNEF